MWIKERRAGQIATYTFSKLWALRARYFIVLAVEHLRPDLREQCNSARAYIHGKLEAKELKRLLKPCNDAYTDMLRKLPKPVAMCAYSHLLYSRLPPNTADALVQASDNLARTDERSSVDESD